MADYDFSIALEIASHIRYPCKDFISGGDLRHVYLRLAEEVIKKFDNPFAINLLEIMIRDYS